MKTNYKKAFGHPLWQRKRLEIMRRDGFKCLFCGDSESQLNVHHCFYVSGRKPWQYSDESLFTLCRPCHSLISDEDPDYEHPSHIASSCWELEVLSYLKSCLHLPSREWTEVNVYEWIHSSECVLSKKVNGGEAAKVVSEACKWLLTPEWLTELKQRTESAKREQMDSWDRKSKEGAAQ